jgi:hypothetical protein
LTIAVGPHRLLPQQGDAIVTVYQDISIHIVEIRHNGPTVQYKVDSLDDYVLFTVKSSDGKIHGGSEQARHLNDFFKTMGLEGVEARAATITLPPVTLETLFKNSEQDINLNISSVCSTYDLMDATRKSGAVGTVYTAEDVSPFLAEAENEEYEALSDEEKEEFLADHWKIFVRKIEDYMTGGGNQRIENRVADELENCLEEFRAKHPAAPGM